MSTERDRQKRAEAVRAALRRAAQPSIYADQYAGGKRQHVNGDLAWQLERQKHPASLIGFNMAWLKKTLTGKGYKKYFKHCINRWWEKGVDHRKRRS